MSSNRFVVGQRWISNTQPELGLGIVMRLEPGRVQMLFPATGEVRLYSQNGAPLRRVAFERGDFLKPQDGKEFVVNEVIDLDGLLTYCGEGIEIPESGVADTMSFNKPESRLLSGVADNSDLFKLRRDALYHRCSASSRNVRGLVGGRIALIPHQLYIAHEIASRYVPRVLLADEVGLGKTIEACLILHRLYLSGRVRRALILVPESLVHQWFVELLRRFHIRFAIFDEERCLAIEEKQHHANPFLDDQLLLCSVDWMARSGHRLNQAAAAGWDMMIVDEAHHLEWSPEKASESYLAVETLAANTPALLLLTATPEQLGREGHFARLRLLDPARYYDFAEFEKEFNGYRAISRLADRILSDTPLAQSDLERSEKLVGGDAVASLKSGGDAEARAALVSALVDLHGTGRVIFRNRRLGMEGFPGREAELIPLPLPENDGKGTDWQELIDREYRTLFGLEAAEEHTRLDYRFAADPRTKWLADLLRENPREKFLLICCSREKAEALAVAIQQEINVELGLFHEDLTLIQRDRNAAWFAEPGGARLLICSEIGSEGRNFQFSHHLVLFDLPIDPALLEQRIGRLDRIGQTRVIRIHVPFLAGTVQELWARWYHEGLNAFEQSLHGSEIYMRRFRRHLQTITLDKAGEWRDHWKGLLAGTIALKKDLDDELEHGRDHLLELSSCRFDIAEALENTIGDLDAEPALEEFMLRLLDHFGIAVEDLESRTYLLKGDHLFSVEAFPGIPEEGLTITFDRGKALAREEMAFLTWDHPLVAGGIEQLLSSEQGGCAFVAWADSGRQGLLLEAVYVLECVAPEKLHPERFLPPTPMRVVVDHDRLDCTSRLPVGHLAEKVRDARRSWLRENALPLKKIVPAMIEATLEIAQQEAESIRAGAMEKMHTMLGSELRRLEELRVLKHPVREDEIRAASSGQSELEIQISGARLRLDSIRLIRMDA